MPQSKAFVLTNQQTEVGGSRHSSLTHFLDLVDACGLDLIVRTHCLDVDALSFYKLIFVDALHANNPTFFEQAIFKTSHKSKAVLFGVSTDNSHLEEIALRHGLRGVFYANDKLEITLKGIQKVLSGKTWFKRDTMEQVLHQLISETSKQSVINPLPNEQASSLTRREKMIVSLIGQGAQNKEIAQQLHISINTVKTHVYSIFRKTDCRNRVELIKWSLETNAIQRVQS